MDEIKDFSALEDDQEEEILGDDDILDPDDFSDTEQIANEYPFFAAQFEKLENEENRDNYYDENKLEELQRIVRSPFRGKEDAAALFDDYLTDQIVCKEKVEAEKYLFGARYSDRTYDTYLFGCLLFRKGEIGNAKSIMANSLTNQDIKWDMTIWRYINIIRGIESRFNADVAKAILCASSRNNRYAWYYLRWKYGESFDGNKWLCENADSVGFSFVKEEVSRNHPEACAFMVNDFFKDQKLCKNLDDALDYLNKAESVKDFMCQILSAYQLWIHGNFEKAISQIDETINNFKGSKLRNDYKIYVENVGKRYSIPAGIILATAASALKPEIFDYVKKNSNLSPETWIVLSHFIKNSKDHYQFCLRMAFKKGYHPCPNYVDGILSDNVCTHIGELEKKLQGEIEYRQQELYFNNAGYLTDIDFLILLKRISENTDNYYFVLTEFRKRYPDECEALLSILWDDKKSLIPVMKRICGTGYEYLLSTKMSSFLYQTITDFFFENPEEGTAAIWKFLGTASIHQDESVRGSVIGIANLTSILQDLINRAVWKLNLSNEDYLHFEWQQNFTNPHRDFSGYGRSLLEYDQEIKKGIRDAERFKGIITKTYKENDKPLISFIDYTTHLLKDYTDATHNYLGLMKGYRGEEAVYKYLQEYCSSWIILRNINVPVDEEMSDSVENDFIALGNGGIFSIEVKNYSNKTITISKDGMVSGQEFGKEKMPSKNIVTQMSRHEAYLAKYLQENYDDKTIDFDQYVKSIAVISNHEDSLTINNETDLKIVRLQMLRKTLTGHVIPNPLSREQLSEIAEVLKRGSLPDKKYEFIDVGLAWCWRSQYRDIAESISKAVLFFSKS